MAIEGTDHRVPVWVRAANQGLVQSFADFSESVTDESGSYDVVISRQAGVNSFTHSGNCWDIRFGVESTHLPDSAGLRCISHLLGHPHEHISVFVLVALSRGTETSNTPVLVEYADPRLDAEATQQIRGAIRDLQAELDDAREVGDEQRAEQARDNLERLQEFFDSDRGLGGKARRFSNNSIRARQAVLQAIKRARQAMGKEAPMLAAHLKQAITVSATAIYAPTFEIQWDTHALP